MFNDLTHWEKRVHYLDLVKIVLKGCLNFEVVELVTNLLCPKLLKYILWTDELVILCHKVKVWVACLIHTIVIGPNYYY